MHRLTAFLLISLLIFSVESAFGQLSRGDIKRNNKNIRKYQGNRNAFTKEKKYTYVGLSGVALNYLGDIAPAAGVGSTKVSFTRGGVGLVIGRRIGPRYSIQGGLMYGRIASDDAQVADPQGDRSKFRYVRNASFRNDIYELSFVGIVDLFKNGSSYLARVPWTPYLFAGVSGFYHNPKGKVPDNFTHTGAPLEKAGEWVALKPLGTEGQNADLVETDANFGIKPYSLWQVAIPVGIGFRFRLGEALDASIDFAMRFTFTDYLDDVSRNYVDLGVLDSDLAKAMSDRSLEPSAVMTGDARDLSGWNTTTYTGRDGQTYTVINGFGSEYPTNVRGSAGADDLFFVTNVRIAYILGAPFRRAKFR